jgi:hypothetical protein
LSQQSKEINKKTNQILMAAKSYVLTSGSEIHKKLLAELGNAKISVKVAVAWFTNQELLDALILAAERSCKIDLIIADNDENKKLDFNKLGNAGATIVKIKNTGYGMMHQKYCVIDDKLAVTGSFNWTNNAIKNNSENAIFSEESDIISSLNLDFEKIQKNELDDFQPIEKAAGNKVIRVETSEEAEFVEDLQKLTETLISPFDETEVEAYGFKKAEEHKGESSIFPSLLTSALNSLRQSIAQDEDRKRNFKKRVELLWESRKSQIKDKHDREITALDNLLRAEKQIIESKKGDVQNQIDEERGKTIELKSTLNTVKMKLEVILEDIEALKKGLAIRPLNFKRLAPWIIVLLFMSTYLFIFYSSAIYTLQYAQSEANNAMLQGSVLPHVDFFNAKAIVKVWSKGFGAIMFTFLAVLIPLGLASIKLYTDNKFLKVFLGWIIAILVVDAFVAFAISQTLFEVQKLSGEVSGSWDMRQALTSMDFYKVFIFGAIPLIMFKLLVEKLHGMWLASSMDHANKENAHLLRLAKEKELVQKVSVERASHNLDQKNKFIEALFVKIEELKEGLKEYENDTNSRKMNLANEFGDRTNRNERMMEIFISDIDGARTGLIGEAFKARAAIIRTGWQRFLSSYFATEQVNIRVGEIEEIYTTWMQKSFK